MDPVNGTLMFSNDVLFDGDGTPDSKKGKGFWEIFCRCTNRK